MSKKIISRIKKEHKNINV